jgi:hypothetical protein
MYADFAGAFEALFAQNDSAPVITLAEQTTAQKFFVVIEPIERKAP